MLAKLISELDDSDWEVKTVIPLVSARTYVAGLTNGAGSLQSSWGAGYGYAAPYIEGMVVICQRRVEMTDEEYAAWRAEKEAEAARTALQEQARAARADEGKRIAASIRALPLEAEPSGRLLSRSNYRFDGVLYDSRAAALVAQEEKARKVEADYQSDS